MIHRAEICVDSRLVGASGTSTSTITQPVNVSGSDGERGREVDVSASRFGPDGEVAAGGTEVVGSGLAGGSRVVHVHVLEVHGSDPIGVLSHHRGRVDARPGQVAGVRAEPELGRGDGVEYRSQLPLGLDQSSDMGVQRRSHALGGDRLGGRSDGVDHVRQRGGVGSGADSGLLQTGVVHRAGEEGFGVAKLGLYRRVATGTVDHVGERAGAEVGSEVAGSGDQAVLGEERAVGRSVVSRRRVGVDAAERGACDLAECSAQDGLGELESVRGQDPGQRVEAHSESGCGVVGHGDSSCLTEKGAAAISG